MTLSGLGTELDDPDEDVAAKVGLSYFRDPRGLASIQRTANRQFFLLPLLLFLFSPADCVSQESL